MADFFTKGFEDLMKLTNEFIEKRKAHGILIHG